MLRPPRSREVKRAYPALPVRAGVGSIPANSNALNVPSFRLWRFEMKLSPWFGLSRAWPNCYWDLFYSSCTIVLYSITKTLTPVSAARTHGPGVTLTSVMAACHVWRLWVTSVTAPRAQACLQPSSRLARAGLMSESRPSRSHACSPSSSAAF
jgi:hypothetical protein